jgi:hypothetical protein
MVWRRSNMLTSKDINEIAKTYVDTILAQDLTRAEAIMVVALIQARVVSAVAPTSLPLAPAHDGIEKMIEKEVPAIVMRQVPVASTKRSIQYDAEHDPAPDIDVVEPPPRADLKGKQLAPTNKACICSKCESIIYVTNQPIIDGMSIGSFINAFTPGDGIPEMTRKSTIKNVDGNISTDCPACGGVKTVYLVGKKPAGGSGGVSSIVSV